MRHRRHPTRDHDDETSNTPQLVRQPGPPCTIIIVVAILLSLLLIGIPIKRSASEALCKWQRSLFFQTAPRSGRLVGVGDSRRRLPVRTPHIPPQGRLFGGDEGWSAVWVPPASKDGVVVVYFHAVHEDLASASVANLMERITSTGMGWMAVEYPGYSTLCNYTASEATILHSSSLALDHLRSHLGVTAERTVLIGWSLGAYVAAEMGRAGHGAKVVLAAPFTSTADLVKVSMYRHSSWQIRTAGKTLPKIAPLIICDQFNTLFASRSILVPVLVLHGGSDDISSQKGVRRIAHALPRGDLFLSARAGHDILHDFEAWGRVLRFI